MRNALTHIIFNNTIIIIAQIFQWGLFSSNSSKWYSKELWCRQWQKWFQPKSRDFHWHLQPLGLYFLHLCKLWWTVEVSKSKRRRSSFFELDTSRLLDDSVEVSKNLAYGWLPSVRLVNYFIIRCFHRKTLILVTPFDFRFRCVSRGAKISIIICEMTAFLRAHSDLFCRHFFSTSGL